MDKQVEHTQNIKLRQISSLDSSSLFESHSEKKQSLKSKNTGISVPTYPPSKPYKNNQLKSLFARARYFYSIVKQRLSGRDYPVLGVIVVNNRCNWDCLYCFGDYYNRRETDYTTDEIKHIVDEMYDMGTRYINMHGGETLLRDDIGDLCNYIKNKGMYLCVITNGSLLAKKIDDVRNVDNLTISLDGAPEGNDYNRGENTFNITLDAIALARREGLKVRVSATLTKHTMHDIGFMAKLAQEYNFHLYYSILFKPLKRAHDSQMSNEDIRFALQEILKYKKMGYPLFTTEKTLRAAYEWPFDFNETYHTDEDEIPESYRPHHIKCFYSKTKFIIEADGYIYPCFLTTDGSFAPQNWKEVGVRNAIAHCMNTNTCRACPSLSQNDHNLLLGLSPSQIAYVIKDQFKETLGIQNKVAK